MACLPRLAPLASFAAHAMICQICLLCLLVGCAGGEVDDDGGVSFGGSNPTAPTATAPTMPSTAAMTDFATDGATSLPTSGASNDGSDVTGVVDPDTTAGDDATGEPGTTAVPETCGNGSVDDPEECDANAFAGASCISLGFADGLLSCTPQCTFDKSACVSAACGDAKLSDDEECDCGNQGATCTAAQLGNTTCNNLQNPMGAPYTGGTLTCNSPASCSFNKAGCTYCGDGLRNGSEACDGADLGGATCNSLGFTGGGALSCSATCTHNTSACQQIACGNGQCEPGEDECGCPQDCVGDPNSCSQCECGGYSENCACDAACLLFGDCCFNGPC